MRRAFFFIVAIVFATTSYASIPRASVLDRANEDASAFVPSLSETRIRVSAVLAPFEQPAESELTRALRQGYEQASTTNASGLGGFLSVDPALDPSRNMRTPQRWNRYAYAVNNPLKYNDPDGRKDRVVFISMLDAKLTPDIERQLNRAVRGTRFEGNVTIVGPGATPGSVKTWVRRSDASDIVGVLLHSGPLPANVGGTMMGGGKHANPTTRFTGNDLARAADDGSTPTLVVAGCNSQNCAMTVSRATGATTFGTTTRTVNTEEVTGFVKIVGTLAHGGTPEEAADAGSTEIKTLPPCPEGRPTCNGTNTTAGRYQQNPPE